MSQLIGPAPNQLPRNLDLGSLAYQDENNVNVGGGQAYLTTSQVQNSWQDTAISDEKPSLNLDFANSKTLDPRITYTRASTGAYWDGSSTVVAEQNLLTYSQDFTVAAWVKNSGTLTANTTAAPDGTTTASSYVPNTTGAISHIIYRSLSSLSGQYTFSIYVKANGYTLFQICDAGNASCNATFDLSAVTTTVVTGSITSSIISVGSGWYKCSITWASAPSTIPLAFQPYPSSGSTPSNYGNSYAGDGISGCYVWGAQLEQRSSATVYTATTTSAITNYIPTLLQATANTPRFDHDIRQLLTGSGNVIGGQLQLPSTFSDGSAPSTLNGFYTGQTVTISGTAYTVTAYTASSGLLSFSAAPAAGAVSFTLTNPDYGRSLGFLIEQQSTNLLTYSSDLSNAIWTKNNSSIVTAADVAPDGTLTAQKWTPTTSGNTSNTRLFASVTVSSATSITSSIYAKSAGKRYIYFAAPDASSPAYNCWFDLQTGTVGTKGASVTSASIVSVGNGWFRLQTTSTSTSTTAYLFLSTTDADNSSTVTADGYSGILIWGAQLEANSFATSYIPTTSSQVTRAADSAYLTAPNFGWLSGADGTVYCEAAPYPAATAINGYLYFCLAIGNATGNRFSVGSDTTSTLRLTSGGTYGSTNLGISGGTIGANKAGLIYTTTGSLKALINAGAVTTSSGYVFYGAPTYLFIGAQSTTQSFVNGYVRKLQYFPKALSAAELQEMTA